MKVRTLFLSIVLLTLFFPAYGIGNQWGQVLENYANGTVNWTQGVVSATGIGAPPEKYYGKPQARPMAIRAAKLDAMRNLLELTKSVRLTSTTLVKDAVVENDVIATKIEGMVSGARIVKKEYLSDGTVEVVMEMGMNGGFAQLVLPEDIKQIPSVTPITPSSPSPSNTGNTNSGSQPAPSGPVLTGIVIDARGLMVRPAMSPKVIDESGQEVYGSAYVSREYAVQQGMAGYAKDITAAQTNPRVTNNPITIKGLRKDGPGGSDIVISNADAQRLKGASEHLSFLKKCRVMIVVD